jgi:CubicO group peptidase (beta-lactamase class C family)
LWGIGSLSDSAGSEVILPEGSFFAAGVGGQFAFVIPAYELVIVHRAAGFQYGGPGFGDMNHLLALIFDAGHLR